MSPHPSHQKSHRIVSCPILSFHLDDERFDYYPEDLTFHEVDAIPRSLMLNVVEKYRHVKEYCKLCFYKTNKQVCRCYAC